MSSIENSVMKELERRKKLLSDEIERKEKILDEKEKKLSLLESRENRHPEWFVVEQNVIGERCMIHKKGDVSVSIFNTEREEIGHRHPTIVGQSRFLSNGDFIIDGKIVDLGNGVNKFLAFDILYHDRSLVDLPLWKRKTELRKLNFTFNIDQMISHIARKKEDMEKFIDLVSDMKMSRGAIIKGYDSPYPTGKENDWIEYDLFSSELALTPDNVNRIRRCVDSRVSDGDLGKVNPRTGKNFTKGDLFAICTAAIKKSMDEEVNVDGGIEQ